MTKAAHCTSVRCPKKFSLFSKEGGDKGSAEAVGAGAAGGEGAGAAADENAGENENANNNGTHPTPA